jgi:NADPH2:quinone reductase
LFDIVLNSVVKIKINQRYALKDAGKAHADLEGRRTTGTTILVP